MPVLIEIEDLRVDMLLDFRPDLVDEIRRQAFTARVFATPCPRRAGGSRSGWRSWRRADGFGGFQSLGMGSPSMARLRTRIA